MWLKRVLYFLCRKYKSLTLKKMHWLNIAFLKWSFQMRSEVLSDHRKTGSHFGTQVVETYKTNLLQVEIDNCHYDIIYQKYTILVFKVYIALLHFPSNMGSIIFLRKTLFLKKSKFTLFLFIQFERHILLKQHGIANFHCHFFSFKKCFVFSVRFLFW